MLAVVAVNELGRRVGQSHPAAKLTDRDVELLLQLRERDGLGYGRLAVMFELSRSQVRYICTGRSRCQVPVEWRQVRVA